LKGAGEGEEEVEVSRGMRRRIEQLEEYNII